VGTTGQSKSYPYCTFHIEDQTPATFDEKSFQDAIASVLGILPDNVIIYEIRSGSVFVDFYLAASNGKSSDQLTTELNEQYAANNTLFASYGYNVVGVDVVEDPTTHEDSSSTDNTGTIAAAVLIPAAVVIFVGIIVALEVRKRRLNNKHDMEMGEVPTKKTDNESKNNSSNNTKDAPKKDDKKPADDSSSSASSSESSSSGSSSDSDSSDSDSGSSSTETSTSTSQSNSKQSSSSNSSSATSSSESDSD